MRYLFIILLYLLALRAYPQETDSLLNQLSEIDEPEPVVAIFKSTRVILSQSVETQKKYNMEFRVRHHFGDIGGRFGGTHTLFGLDVASDILIGLDYGLSDRLTAGIGRSRKEEMYYLSLKYKAIQQKEGAMPIGVTLFAQTGVATRKPFTTNEFDNFSDRTSHVLQAIIARKISPSLSLEVIPGYLLRTYSPNSEDQNNLFSLGFAGRLKLTKRMSVLADYNLVNAFGRPDLSGNFYNPLAMGLEIETGGHIFSLTFMNSEYILENNFIPDTQKSWTDGGIRFGFTITRSFTIFKPKNPDIKSNIY